jgi:ribosome maturation factor RimP
MPKTSLDPDLHGEISAAAESVGCELLHAAFHQGALRVFLDRPEGGVTIEDCQTVSKLISPLLDVHDFGDRRYVLEVSSPGLDRELYGPRDYLRFQGNLVRVTFFGGEERTKATVVGRLEQFDEEAATLLVHEEDSDRRHHIPVADVKIARLEVEL